MEMNILNIANIGAGFIAVLFIMFLLTLKTERSLPNYMLAVYLLRHVPSQIVAHLPGSEVKFSKLLSSALLPRAPLVQVQIGLLSYSLLHL